MQKLFLFNEKTHKLSEQRHCPIVLFQRGCNFISILALFQFFARLNDALICCQLNLPFNFFSNESNEATVGRMKRGTKRIELPEVNVNSSISTKNYERCPCVLIKA